MKNKGFTLIELIGVVVILSIISLIAFPSILNQIKKSQKNIDEATKKMILLSAKDYLSEHSDLECVSVDKLIETGYLDGDIVKNKKLGSVNKNNEYTENGCLYINDLLKKEGTSGDGTLERIEQPATVQTLAQTEYRYRGKNPNNYVIFNDELWRIIGIVDGKVKLIRNENLGDYAWDNKNKSTEAESDYGKNDWSDARLMMLLNPKSDGTSYTGTGGSLYWNKQSGTCYSGQNNSTKACDFTSIGLSDAAKAMIDKSNWYLGGWNSKYIKTEEMYQKERGTTVYSGRSTKWVGYVGLMYPSDYGYAATRACSDSYNLFEYLNCNDNWLFKDDDIFYWTITPNSETSNGVFDVRNNVTVDNHLFVFVAYGVRPALYLKPNVLITGGEGSKTSPYQLTLN